MIAPLLIYAAPVVVLLLKGGAAFLVAGNANLDCELAYV